VTQMIRDSTSEQGRSDIGMKISVKQETQNEIHTAVIFACNEGGMGAFPPLFANIPLKVLRGAPPKEGGGRGAGLCNDTTAGAGLGAL
jgi:hypothetical protein